MAGEGLGDSIVFASLQPPFPATSGAPIRTHRLLTGLAASFETTFITFEHHPASGHRHATRGELESLLPGIRIVTVPGLPARNKRLEQGLSLFSRNSWLFGRYRLPAFRDALRRTAAHDRVSIVHFDDPGVAFSGPVNGAVNAFAPHNVEHRIIEGTARTSGGLRRLFAEIDSRKLAREEQQLWRSMTLCIAVSDIDARAMRAGGAKRVEVCPNGADPVEQLPPPRRVAEEPLRVPFIGTAYEPNRRGLDWFLTEVLPRLRRNVPATVSVVGDRSGGSAATPGVTYHGRVPSVTPFYEESHVTIVPILYGSGTRMKVIEAMAYGRPVVSTSVGAEGLPVEGGIHYFRADDPDDFAGALTDVAALCTHGDDRLLRMLAEARAAMEPLLWPRIVDVLVGTYRQELERAKLPSAAATSA